MKISFVITLGFACGIAATFPQFPYEHSVVRRDLAAVTNVLSGISKKVDDLDSSIKAFQGQDIGPVVKSSTDLVSAINSGTEAVKTSGALSSVDALGLTGPVQDVTAKVKKTIDDLISRKSDAVKAAAGAETYKQLQNQYTAAKNLADAITSKVPDALQNIASQLSAGITDAIQKGLDAFKDVSASVGKPAGGGSPNIAAGSGEVHSSGPDSSSGPSPSSTSLYTTASSAIAPVASSCASSSRTTKSVATPSVPLFTGGACVNRVKNAARGIAPVAALALAV
ncbi:hypothetical protein ETB97_007076 [Aspergillus alliaceus]|uniref:Cell wall mannoprotein 1 n=1 Tax=Petromyces alliaceus TaxID=209559 RepID=A0A8H5ZX05_PETAA|nr:hypothetical protein ETB97_007076 [Aspergillus burnettii]